MRDRVVFFLNGQKREIPANQAGLMLSDYLRREAGLPGTKVVCAEGDCGACTVLRIFPKPGPRPGTRSSARGAGAPEALPVNSCITTLAQMDGSSLITVEALGTPQAPSLVQSAMMKCHGSQCGFCTPGFVMALSGLVEKRLAGGRCEPLDAQETKNALTGNLCRCTGYQPILDAAASVDLEACPRLLPRFHSREEDQVLRRLQRVPLRLESEEFTFFAPTRLAELPRYLKKLRDARPIAGGTDLGVMHNKRKQRLHHLVSLHLIPDAYAIAVKGGRMRVGARVTLTELRQAVRRRVPELARFLDLFASPQIKHVATLVGNVGNASPIADTPPFLLVARADVLVTGPAGRRRIPLEKFYLGYRKTALKPGELIHAVEFDLPRAGESLALYKVSQRKDLDIATVNAAFRVEWSRDRRRIQGARIAYGGVAATPRLLTRTADRLCERGPAAVDAVLETLHSEMKPIGDLRGSAAFRRVVAGNLLTRFLREHGPAAGAGAPGPEARP
jgi:xanthine dehydrogenase small subunit